MVFTFRDSRNWVKSLVLAMLVVAAILVYATAWRYLGEPAREPAKATATFEFPGFQCRYLKPNTPWQLDSTGIKQRLKAVLVMHCETPKAWLALLIKDYKPQPPDDSELRDEAVRRLSGYFQPDNLEWEQRESEELAGRPALRLVFRGEAGDTLMSGECYCLTHKGIGYWFLTWAPADQAASLQEGFEDLRRRFSLLPDPA